MSSEAKRKAGLGSFADFENYRGNPFGDLAPSWIQEQYRGERPKSREEVLYEELDHLRRKNLDLAQKVTEKDERIEYLEFCIDELEKVDVSTTSES